MDIQFNENENVYIESNGANNNSNVDMELDNGDNHNIEDSIEKTSQSTINSYKSHLDIAKKAGIVLDGSMSYRKIMYRLKNLKTKQNTNYSEGTIRIFLCAFNWKIKSNKNISERCKDLTESFTKQITKISIKANKLAKTNKLTGTQLKNYVDWTVIIKIYNKVRNNRYLSQENYKDYLILSLYIRFGAVRRVADFYKMDVANDIVNNDNTKNYYVNASKPIFIFNAYKTTKLYGTQTFNVPKSLNNIIQEYIQKYNVIGSLLNMTEAGLKARLKLIFKRYIDKNIGVNVLRHSFISFKMNTEYLKPKEREILASKMGHRKNMQDDYYKDVGFENVKIKNNKKYITKHGGHNKYDDPEEKKKAKLESQKKWRDAQKLKNNNPI